MAEALVTIAADGILSKVLSIAEGELAIAWGYKEKLASLHRTLDLIRARSYTERLEEMAIFKFFRETKQQQIRKISEIHHNEQLPSKIKGEDEYLVLEQTSTAEIVQVVVARNSVQIQHSLLNG
ncbi:hypothetical protein L2E82_51785 [Cichorium intybus]|nr:hypothetical protein L2E82_51785 [Cichorium intybus]